MNIKRVIVIIPSDVLKKLEARLKTLQVGGVTVSRVKGYGEYKNLYSIDWMSEHAKVEIFIEEPRLDALIDAMLDLTRADPSGGGIVAVLPVERFLHLRTGTATLPKATPF